MAVKLWFGSNGIDTDQAFFLAFHIQISMSLRITRLEVGK